MVENCLLLLCESPLNHTIEIKIWFLQPKRGNLSLTPGTLTWQTPYLPLFPEGRIKSKLFSALIYQYVYCAWHELFAFRCHVMKLYMTISYFNRLKKYKFISWNNKFFHILSCLLRDLLSLVFYKIFVIKDRIVCLS